MRALADSGHDVTLVAGRNFEADPGWDMTGIEVVRVPELVREVDPARDAVAFFKLYRLLRRTRPFAVHTHLAKAGILGRFAARAARVPSIIHTVHGPTFPAGISRVRRTAFRLMERICGFCTDRFVFVGEELRDEYVRAGVCPPGRTTVIRTGRPTSDFEKADSVGPEETKRIRQEFSPDKDTFMIGYVGRLVPGKAQDKAIRVLKKLRDAGLNAHLVLIGEGHVKSREETNYQSSLRALANELGLSRHVHFTGFRPNVFSYMKAMDALILTSRYEGLPNVAVEAAIVGRPFVTFKVCGAAEVVNTSGGGVIVENGDIDGMAKALEAFSRNPAWGREMARSANHAVREIYRMERMVAEKMLFYRDVLGA
ncbi:MAG: glycosyltransferase family 4 protein [Candidatus Krumholzibacteriota bacterium]|nr:glycosyltransferase family 4 protein [Candidatus Krumholzibacteriota bacterium]